MVCLNVAKDEKLTVGGNEFQTFMIRSTKKNICRIRPSPVKELAVNWPMCGVELNASLIKAA